MAHTHSSLAEKYPPSPPCSCAVCLAYCTRPGWWTVAEAAAAIEAGYGRRMMLEVAPDLSFGVVSPAFGGNLAGFAENRFAPNGCNFLKDGLCELHGTGHQPLECRFCHHERRGLGPVCHADLEREWNSSAGHRLVVGWSKAVGLWAELSGYGFEWVEAGARRSRHPKPSGG